MAKADTYSGKNQEHVGLFLFEMNHYMPLMLLAILFTKPELINCLNWVGGEAKLKELEFRLKNTDWFIRPFSIRKIFNNYSTDIVLQINSKRLLHIALLMRLLKEECWIEPEIGKGYMEAVSKHISYNKQKVTAKKFNKWSSEILKNEEKYKTIIAAVKTIIEHVKKVS